MYQNSFSEIRSDSSMIFKGLTRKSRANDTGRYRTVVSTIIAGLLSGVSGAALAEADTLEQEPISWPSSDRIIIVGKRAHVDDVPGSAAFVDIETLQKQSYDDINRILRVVPGVNLQEDDGFGLRPNIGLRGTGLDRSSKITLMEDGVLIAPAPYSAPSAYYFPNTGRMSGIEIVKGAGGIKYGPRTQGGSINLLSTEIPDQLSAFGSFKAGSYNSRKIHAWVGAPLTGKNGGLKISGLIEYYANKSDGFKQLDNGGDTGLDVDDVVAKLHFETPDGAAISQSLEVKIQASDEVSNVTYLGLTDADFAINPFRRYAASALDQMDAKHSEVSARWRADFGNGFDLTALAYQTRYSRNWFRLERVNTAGSAINSGKSGVGLSDILDDPVTYAAEMDIIRGTAGLVSAPGSLLMKYNNRDYVSRGVQAILGWQGEAFGASHNFEASVRLHEDEQDRFQWRDRYSMNNGALVLSGVDTPGTESNRVDSASALAIYVQDQIDIGRWRFVPGARLENVKLYRDDFGRADPSRSGVNLREIDNSITAFVPGLGIIFDASDNWSLFGGVHRGFSPPAPGRANSAPETATNWELGGRFSNGSTRIEATGFFNSFGNMIGTVTASTGGGGAIGDQFDAGAVDVYGLELSGETDLAEFADAGFQVPLRFAYTYSSAEFQNSFASNFKPWGNVLANDQVPYIPEHQLSGSIGFETGRFGSELAASVIGDVRTQAGQGPIPVSERVDGRTVWDASFWFEPVPKIRLGVSARNLTDNVYAAARRPVGMRPGMPRTVLFSVAVKY